MPTGPAARLTDMTAHGSPLSPGIGSPNVLIGGLPAWRGLGAAGVAALAAAVAKAATDIAEASAKAAAAAATPAGPAAQANLVETAASAVADIGATMAASGADIHACPIVKVVIPDGPGVVITGSQTVSINGMPACRLGDTIQEATSVNMIAMGQMNVIIGDVGMGRPVSANPGAATAAFRSAATSGAALVCKGECEACGQA